ncbi:iron-containing alcohol dehydrogenase [Photobacterium minamisatsumaniensis]|uniref:iron-containing alcohol dehydrogenase n=1 Tax=Photobacterium minamisatsumaniensis TaxID=2910233 RepID=UPI003D0DCFA3
MQFTYLNSTKIHFGQGQIETIAQEIGIDKKVLLIYGGGSIKKNGVYDQLSRALQNHKWIEFSGVEPNPKMETLDRATHLAREEHVDYILAVGGGSVIDGAKYIAAATLYHGDGWDIPSGKHVISQALPIGCILTLPATGSESNTGAVISKQSTREKLVFFSEYVQPQFAVLDPDVMKTLPERQLINGVVDAWVHVCEQYLTVKEGAYVQDGYAEVLLRSLLKLGGDFECRDSTHWRENLMWVANQALNGLIGVGVSQDWSTHSIGHELTALFGVDHARSLAIVQPAMLRNQMALKRGKLEQMGKQVFLLTDSEDLAERTIIAIEHFYWSLGVETTLKVDDKTNAVQSLCEQLEIHGMVALGESQKITLDESKEILKLAIESRA